MNINELCRVLKYIYKEEYRSDYIDDAADLLLQQQAEIEAMRKVLKEWRIEHEVRKAQGE